MVTTALVDRQITEGQKLIKRLDQTSTRFDIAFWMLVPDADDWRLVMGTDGINQQGTRKKYQLIQTVLKQEGVNLSLDEISIVDTNSSLCALLKSSVKTDELLTPMPFFGNFLHGQRFPDAVIYRVR